MHVELLIFFRRFPEWLNPRDWPFIVWWCLAIFSIGPATALYKWAKRNQALGWPIAFGTINYVAVTKKSSRGGSYAIAEIMYSYEMAGESYTGRYKERVESEEEGWDLVQGLQTKPITLHYNPVKPHKSMVLKEDLAAAAAARGPVEHHVQNVAPIASWITPFLKPLITLSTAGFLVSLWVHINALLGRTVLPEGSFFLMHTGIFVVFFPAVLVARNRPQSKNRWTDQVRGAPIWMNICLGVLFIYALLNFALFGAQHQGHSTGVSATTWRGFSGHWMLFYFASLTMLYSAATQSSADTTKSEFSKPIG